MTEAQAERIAAAVEQIAAMLRELLELAKDDGK